MNGNKTLALMKEREIQTLIYVQICRWKVKTSVHMKVQHTETVSFSTEHTHWNCAGPGQRRSWKDTRLTPPSGSLRNLKQPGTGQQVCHSALSRLRQEVKSYRLAWIGHRETLLPRKFRMTSRHVYYVRCRILTIPYCPCLNTSFWMFQKLTIHCGC